MIQKTRKKATGTVFQGDGIEQDAIRIGGLTARYGHTRSYQWMSTGSVT
ncbi:MAG: hypothetical protein LBU17_00170 [Treponema sp.]|nr:hypothetical protein [Treponema sp.]